MASRNTQVMIKAQMKFISLSFSSCTFSEFNLFYLTQSHIPIFVPFVTLDGLHARTAAAAAVSTWGLVRED